MRMSRGFRLPGTPSGSAAGGGGKVSTPQNDDIDYNYISNDNDTNDNNDINNDNDNNDNDNNSDDNNSDDNINNNNNDKQNYHTKSKS